VSSERDRVNSALDSAREQARTIPASGAVDAGVVRAFAFVLCDCTEALVRQVRDLDDDVWQVKEQIEQNGNDLVTFLDGRMGV
jgi:hypothetical protein